MRLFINPRRFCSTAARPGLVRPETVTILGKDFRCDDWANFTPKIIGLTDRGLMLQRNNPLHHLKCRIEQFFNENYRKRRSRSPLFSVHDNLHPVVSVWENFDSLLVPADHVSRKKSDTYYINEGLLLRAHTSAHQHALISSGRDQFLVFGDVYRRDQIDRTHFPVFHQMEALRLFTAEELFDNAVLFEPEATERLPHKQESHTFDCAKVLEVNLKDCLEKLVRFLFGSDLECQWTPCYFPFTHPSWELEVLYQGKWLESLGCGVIEQKLLETAGAGHKVGWAFGLGLERLAMKLYSIPDIRLFWSKDTGFLHQFDTDDHNKNIVYKPFSKCPQCTNDMSFWLATEEFEPNDFYDLVRTVGGDLVEQVTLFDDFTHPKTKRRSHAYRIVYRSMERTLTQEEVNSIHQQIEKKVTEDYGVEIR